jgi:ribosome-associated protein
LIGHESYPRGFGRILFFRAGDMSEPTIHLDQFLKTCGVATGGQAKRLIQGGEVLVNDEIETRRRRQLKVGDEVTLGDDIFVVALQDDSDADADAEAES